MAEQPVLTGYGIQAIVNALQANGQILGQINKNLQGVVTPTAGWTAYTPTLSAGSGSLSSASATGRYQTIGKIVFVEIDITITTNGTAATSIIATLPATAAAAKYVLGGQETTTGKAVTGLIPVSGTDATALFYDGTYPGGDGKEIVLIGVYEAA